jgi:AAA family ATPase
MSSKTFTVELADTSEIPSRAARRVIFNVDTLNTAKVFSGDIIAITNGDSTNTWKVRLD